MAFNQIQCCHNCEERTLYCHSFCKVYIKAKEEADARNKFRDVEKQSMYAIQSVLATHGTHRCSPSTARSGINGGR